jgi:hypothetical protein
MGEVKEMPTPEVQENTKMSYEELERVANDLYIRLQNADMSNMFKRLDYLFKVTEFKDSFTPTFVENCVKEIEMMMTIPSEETKEA